MTTELTADHLDAPDDEDEGFFKPLNLLIALAPMALFAIFFLLKGADIIAEPERVAKPAFFPPVGVIFVETVAEDRLVRTPGTIEAMRNVALRVDQDVTILTVLAETGFPVSKGKAVCRYRDKSGEVGVLFAPIDGVVGRIAGGRGTELFAGQACLSVYDPSGMVALGELTPRQAEVIQPGSLVQVKAGDDLFDLQLTAIYPSFDGKGLDNRMFEVALPADRPISPGTEVKIAVATDQVIATLVPFRALTHKPGMGMTVRIVTGDGPTGIIKTLPVTIVATSADGYYVEGLPITARLVVKDAGFAEPPDGEKVKISRVG